MELDELKQILNVFRGEAREIAEQMTAGLLELESAGPKERGPILEALFRGAHTLKGGAGSLGVDDVAMLSHEIESLLRQCQRGDRQFHASYTDAILGALDEVGRRLDALLSGQTESAEGIRASRARLGKLIAGDVEDPKNAGATKDVRERHADGMIRIGIERIEAIATTVDELVVQRLRVSQRSVDTSRLAQELDLLARRARGGWSAERLADLKRLAHDVSALGRELSLDAQHLSAMTEDLRNGLRSMQVIPASTILDPFRRSVRDHARNAGVDVVLDIVGAEIEADRSIVEGLRGPLVHLLRNAVDHGIEKPAERAQSRKPKRARIRVDVAVSGSQLMVTVSDDGQGMDPARIRKSAIESGLLTAEEARGLDDNDALGLIWRSGFSTATEITQTSGRGVGLDAVREDVNKLGGRIELSTRQGKGSTFRIQVPLMRAASLGLLIESAGVPYLLPLSDVQAVRRVHIGSLRNVGGVPYLERSADSVPVYSLAGVLSATRIPLREADKPLVCVVADETAAAGLVVDAVLGEREMSIRPLGPELARYGHLNGASRTGDGKVVIVLDSGGLLRRAQELARASTGESASRALLIVDDAATSRLLHRTLFEQQGWRVLLATNGEEALELLQAHAVDAIVSDVRMPRMDGLELTRRIRRMAVRADVPIVLLTSLASELDRQAGLTAGANTYLVKGETPPALLVEILAGFVS